MSLDAITSTDTGRRKHARVGRGTGSRLGKTCGRGEKGQSSRSGGGPSPRYEGGQFPLWQRLPKRGFTNARHTVRYQPVRLDRLLAVLPDDVAVVDFEVAIATGFGHIGERLKLVGTLSNEAGEAIPVPRKLVIRLHRVSAATRAAIEAAGGSVEELDART